MTTQADLGTADAVEAGIGRRWPVRAAVYGAASLAVLLPTSTAGAGWYLASYLLDAGRAKPYPIRVRSVGDGTVTLPRMEEFAGPLRMGLTWLGGHAVLGDVLSTDRTSVVREVVEVSRGTLRPGIRAYSNAYVYEGDPTSAHGLPFDEVTVPGELGGMPAWLVPPTTPAHGTWIIAVHGRGAPRGEVLRVLPTLAASGMHTLVITYRNDTGAPHSLGRQYHLGDTEWRDVAAAIQYAVANGARSVVLYGWSMGGAAILTTMRRLAAPDVDAVRGIVLDCPVVDWVTTLRMNARRLALPPSWAWATLRLVERRIGVRLAQLDHRRYAPDLAVPVLAFVDRDDMLVSPGPTLEFAAARPDLVTLVETRTAGHCRSWNLDPERYEAALADFLHDAVPRPA
ncbi:MAG TPA: alpha/beta hydrolase [Micromonosporaceae bacterium]|nr:alpha/beta hydrolase [Micromonosporaceae bacterium]